MNYADARDHIATGDLIAVRKKHGLLPRLTRLPGEHIATFLLRRTAKENAQ